MAQRVLEYGWQTVEYTDPQVVWVVKNKVRKSIAETIPTGDFDGVSFLGPEVIPAGEYHFQGPGVLDEYEFTGSLEDW